MPDASDYTFYMKRNAWHISSAQQKRKPWQSSGAAPQVLQRDILPDGDHEQYRT